MGTGGGVATPAGFVPLAARAWARRGSLDSCGLLTWMEATLSLRTSAMPYVGFDAEHVLFVADDGADNFLPVFQRDLFRASRTTDAPSRTPISQNR